MLRFSLIFYVIFGAMSQTEGNASLQLKAVAAYGTEFILEITPSLVYI
jgi:hypothetical protein